MSLTSSEQRLLSMDLKDFATFDMNGYRTTCKILRVHDADTLTIGFEYGAKFYKKNIRLTGIDAPELRSVIPDEAKLCRLGREYIKLNYLDQLVVVEMGEMDKYGRILATLYDRITNENINAKLIECKFVRSYGVGGDLHKQDWASDELQSGITIAGGMGIEDPGK